MNRDRLSLSLSSRRHFLRGTTTALAGIAFVPGHVLGLNGAEPPSAKLNLAHIGVAGQGRIDLDELARDCNVVALCDVDDRRATAAFNAYPAARRFKDFRRMLDEVGKEIDGVVVSTPDHTHAVAAMRAIKMRKHVYCQKPLAHSIHEVRALVAAAREQGVTTQLGNQGHATSSIRRFCQMIRSGVIGNVRLIETRMERVLSAVPDLERARRGEPVPAGLDWDLWLGPAKFRPYSSAYLPFKWRNWRAFGDGGLGDFVCHLIDPVFWALDLGAPSTVLAEPGEATPATRDETFAPANIVHFEFPAKGSRPAVKLTWNDGNVPVPEIPELEAEKFPRIGVLVTGDKGRIVYGTHGATSCRLVPDDRMAEYVKVEKPSDIPKSPGHYQEWVQACKAGKAAGADFSYGGPLTEIALVGIIATRFPGQKLEWDSLAGKFTNFAEANPCLRPEFREGWDL